MRLPILLALIVAFPSFGGAQVCENGQCFRTPLRSTAKAIAQAQPVRSAVRGVYQSVSSVRASNVAQSYGSTGTAAYYGSTGSSAVSYGSVGSAVYYNSSYCYDRDGALVTSVGVPVRSAVRGVYQSYCYDRDGALITSVGVPYASSVSSGEASSLGFRQRRASREVIVEAATQAHADGTITETELKAIRLASRSPRMLARMEDLILEKAQSSGAYSFALDSNGDVIKAAINWEAIGDFILKIAPIIFKFIEMFALDTSGDGAATMFAKSYLPPLNFVATLSQFSGC